MRFYDFEVFKHDWLVVVKDVMTREKFVIHNNSEELNVLFNQDVRENVNRIWTGYNSNHYDKWIMFTALDDRTPQFIHRISSQILQDVPAWKLMRESNIPQNRHFYTYDTMTDKFKSLKQLEGYMGHDIRECSVPWDIDRPLTPEELEAVISYCEHDVDETIEVFLQTHSTFKSKMGLIKKYKLGLDAISKSAAQLSAYVLGAKKTKRYDEFDITIVDTLKINKYTQVIDWYKSIPRYGEQLKVKVAGILNVFGWGGLHGAIKSYMGEGLYILTDVDSQHPGIMISYDFLSRNVQDKDDYRVIRDTRMKLKADKNPEQEDYKLVLNATNGAAKDPYNPLYDPLQNNNVCITAQLSLLDLIERVEDLIEMLVQSNTDGILVKLRSRADLPEYMRRCKEWETRMRLSLGHDEYVRVIQKDVNNYILIEADGNYKAKGAYVKKLSEIDNQLPIVNTAVIEYFTHGTRVEDTIGSCRSLRQFQMIVKKGAADYILHGNHRQDVKVIRVFASKDNSDSGLYRRMNGNNNKAAGTPIHCFIDNTNVTEKRCPRKLNKQWYIDMAHDRISDFMGMDNHQQIRLF